MARSRARNFWSAVTAALVVPGPTAEEGAVHVPEAAGAGTDPPAFSFARSCERTCACACKSVIWSAEAASGSKRKPMLSNDVRNFLMTQAYHLFSPPDDAIH